MSNSKKGSLMQSLLKIFGRKNIDVKEGESQSEVVLPQDSPCSETPVKTPIVIPQVTTVMTEFEQRAYYCTMGDICSMMWMFWSFINQTQAVPYVLNENNWREIVIKNGGQMNNGFQEYISQSQSIINYYSDQDIALQAAIFWLDRASIYGSSLAKEILDTYPFCEYRNHVFEIRINNITEGIETKVTGSKMKKIGLMEFEREGSHETSSRYKGIFECNIRVDYADPDDDGFGGGAEYNFYFYNEFYEILHVEDYIRYSQRFNNYTIENIKEKCKSSWLEKQKIRDAFWERNKNNPKMEQYHQLIAPEIFEMDQGV
ncbi:MAG: hypothetical protein R3Y24_04675 [Eubacteriales bacterium]